MRMSTRNLRIAAGNAALAESLVAMEIGVGLTLLTGGQALANPLVFGRSMLVGYGVEKGVTHLSGSETAGQIAGFAAGMLASITRARPTVGGLLDQQRAARGMTDAQLAAAGAEFTASRAYRLGNGVTLLGPRHPEALRAARLPVHVPHASKPGQLSGLPQGQKQLTAGSPETYPAQAQALVASRTTELVARGETSGVALARPSSSADGVLGPSYINFFPYDPVSKLAGAVHVPSALSNNLFRIADPDLYIRSLQDLYRRSGTPLHPEIEANIRAHIGDGSRLVGKGLPGTHAEVRAQNWGLNNGMSSDNMTIHTYRLVEGASQGGPFVGCHNCSMVISPQVHVPTGRTPDAPWRLDPEPGLP
jgi:hypothetical protein